MSKPLRNRLSSERKRLGWSRRYVADQIGVSEYSIGQWERGEHRPYPEHIQRLCELFSMNAEELGLAEVDEEKFQVQDVPSFPPMSNEPERMRRDTTDQERVDTNPRSPLPTHRRQKRLVFWLAGIGILLITFGVLSYRLLSNTAPIKPGGGWISPRGNTADAHVHFAAYAYPTHASDPAIDHVKFTMYWQGVDPREWIIACVARTPMKQIVFACDADLRKLGTLPGEIKISFDVYDQQGNHNNAPNGIHTLLYSPSCEGKSARTVIEILL